MDGDINTMEEERMSRLNQARLDGSNQQNKNGNEKQNQEQQRINNTSAALMIVVALIYDGLQALLEWVLVGFAVNWILDVWAWLTFYVWFKLKNANFANPKRAACLNGGFLLELIPVVEELPIWTMSIIIMIMTVKAEDKLSAISPSAGKAISAATGGK